MCRTITLPPVKQGESRPIRFTYDELIRIGDALCFYAYDDTDDNGKLRECFPKERITEALCIVDKIDKHI